APALDVEPVIDAEPLIDAAPVIEASRRDTDRERMSRVPWIAIGTGAALAAIVAVVLYVWLPASPRGPLADKPAPAVPSAGAVKTEADAVKTETGVEPARPAPIRDDAARSAGEKPRGADRSDAPAQRRTASTPATSTAPSAAAPSASAPRPGTTERSSVSSREPARPPAPGTGSSSARDDAEQARSRMVAARQGAERVAAGFYARNRFSAAQAKEREGMAALGRSDYAAAAALFGQAQSEYQAATAETPREEDNQRQLARLRGSLDQAHAAVAARRQQA